MTTEHLSDIIRISDRWRFFKKQGIWHNNPEDNHLAIELWLLYKGSHEELKKVSTGCCWIRRIFADINQIRITHDKI